MTLLEDAKAHVEHILNHGLSKDFCYHNATHTKDVVKAILEIGRESGLTEEEMEILELAGWFHDVGYSETLKGHEEAGATIALNFLSEQGYPDLKAAEVVGCIMATRMPQSPKNKIQEIICDADMLHLATEDFFDKTQLLRNELLRACGMSITEKEWMEKNVVFLEAHHFFTPYANARYEKTKLKNLERVKQLLEEMNHPTDMEQKEEKEKKKNKKDKKKEKSPDRGVETMFRLTSKNHLELSAMADNKANILISINAIILSVLISVLIRKLEEYPHLTIPTLILTMVCLITIVFAILVTRPHIARGKFTKEDIHQKKVNLLFFGNFHKMKVDEYEWAMKELMKDADYLYSNLIQDIYYLGVVLGKKYRLLRLAYTFFMFGFVISVISFLLAELFFRPPYPY